MGQPIWSVRRAGRWVPIWAPPSTVPTGGGPGPVTPPTAKFTATANGTTVSFDGSESQPGDAAIASYSWKYGDGATGTGKTSSHTYATTGTYQATLTVTATDGSTGAVTQTVTLAAPPPPSGTAGDPGVNQTGTAGKQQTGSGIVLEQNLTAGSDLTATIKAAAGSVLSFPAGTFSWRDFTHGVDGASGASGNNASGLQLPAGLKGLLGAGSASTALEMVADSSTKGSTVPSSGTNQLQYLDAANLPDGFVIDGINMVGTHQGHLYNGLRLKAPGNVTIQNSTLSGIPGNSGSPPGETFTANVYAQAAGKTINFDHVTFNGDQGSTAVAAALLGTNNTQGTVNITDCLFEHNAYSAGVAIWELAKGAVVNIVRPRITGAAHRNIGNEAQAGTINITDPLFDDPASGEDDIRITWTAAYNSGTINVHFTSQATWNAFIAKRSNKKLLTICTVKQNYGGSNTPYLGSNVITNFCHLFIAGVEQPLSNYWSFTGVTHN